MNGPTFIQSRGLASNKHKKIIKMAKGYRGRANRTFRAAARRVEKGLQYAYRDRKNKKREFRKLWIERLNAGTRQHGWSYSRFIYAMTQINKASSHENVPLSISLNRRMLAELAANEPFSFKAVVDVVKATS
jgi:large subunit ribosomal protein L20